MFLLLIKEAMFCCRASFPEVKEEKPVIVDLEQILQDRAWLVWSSSFSCLQRMRWKRHHFEIEVPDNYYVFEDVTDPEVSQLPAVTMGNNNGIPATPSQGMNAVSNKGKQADTVTIETKFNNDTGDKQTYKFRFEKNRRTEITVSFQKGFTFGASTNFKVGLPQIFGGESGAEVGASAEYQVTSSKGQTFEETVVMEATSDIVVAARSCYVADVKLDDVHVMKPFRSKTRMRMPQGYAPVFIKRKKDGRQVGVYTVRSLADVFAKCACVEIPKEAKQEEKPKKAKAAGAEEVDKSENKAEDKTVEKASEVIAPAKYDGSWVDFYTEGYVEGTFACGHQILLRNVDPGRPVVGK